MQYLAFNLERASRQMRGGVQRHVVFITLEDFSLWSAPNMATTKETIDMVTNQFPERLGHCVLYKAPMIFAGFWSAVKGFIDPVTAAKVTFISGDTSPGSSNDAKMRSILGENWREVTRQDETPYEEGGSRGYRHAEAWQLAVQEEGIWLAQQAVGPE